MTQLNDSREAPLDSLYGSIYGYTLNVSPKKFILGKQYGDLSTVEQEQVLQSVLLNALKHIGRVQCEHEYEFELTKAGQTHCHGMIRCNASDIMKLQLFVHKQLGMPRLDPSICFKYIKTIIASDAWLSYMRKTKNPDSSPIPEYNMFLERSE